jgi:hypothetical protein
MAERARNAVSAMVFAPAPVFYRFAFGVMESLIERPNMSLRLVIENFL